METDVAVLAERRAKMARLRSEHFVAGRDVTSAPRVTSVDEFSQVRDGEKMLMNACSSKLQDHPTR